MAEVLQIQWLRSRGQRITVNTLLCDTLGLAEWRHVLLYRVGLAELRLQTRQCSVEVPDCLLHDLDIVKSMKDLTSQPYHQH